MVTHNTVNYAHHHLQVVGMERFRKSVLSRQQQQQQSYYYRCSGGNGWCAMGLQRPILITIIVALIMVQKVTSFPIVTRYQQSNHLLSFSTSQPHTIRQLSELMASTTTTSSSVSSSSSKKKKPIKAVAATADVPVLNKNKIISNTIIRNNRRDKNVNHHGDDNANHKNSSQSPKEMDMMTMSVIGTILSFGIVYILAGNGESIPDENIFSITTTTFEESEGMLREGSTTSGMSLSNIMKSLFNLQFLQTRMIESLEITGTNIVDAAVPLTTSDLVSVAIGESIAGVIGASFSYLISNLFMGMVNPATQRQQKAFLEQQSSQQQYSNYNNLFPTAQMSSTTTTTSSGTINNNAPVVKMSDAMADTDYIITNVAVKEILASSLYYVSPIVRTLLATTIAIIPYSIVKFNAQRQQQKEYIKQQALEYQLAQDEITLRQQQRNNLQFGNIWKQIQQKINSPQQSSFDPSRTINTLSLSPSSTASAAAAAVTATTPVIQLDWVELFADIVKWLQFDVLYTDFGNGQLLGSNSIFQLFVTQSMLSQQQYVSILIGCECFIFGAITALTSQIYADVLYKYFQFGTISKQEAVNNRTTIDWYMIYISKIIYCAILFGTYGALKEPTESIVMAVGSGGVDNCYGSINYQYCIDTFVNNNPIGPTPEAELRSLITAAISFWNNHSQWLSYLPINGMP